MNKIDIVLSNSGIPCLWEEGGGNTNTGKSAIITGPQGEKLTPIYIRRKGHLSNGQHALIPIYKGCYVIDAWHHNKDFEITIYQIKEIDLENEEVITEGVATFDMNEWDKPVPAFLGDAIKASKEKAAHYHCKEPYFIKEGKQ